MSAGIIGGPSPETSCTPPMLSSASLHTFLGPCNGNARFVPPRPNGCFDTILAEIVEAGFGVVCSVNPLQRQNQISPLGLGDLPTGN
jgi:hypothetical protein